MEPFIAPDGVEFFSLIASYLTAEEQAFVRRGFELARKEHGDVKRRSGEPYITHPLTIAYFLAQHRLDAPTLVAALLHDVAEDTRISIDDITEQFGSDVGRLVDGVTKFEAATDDSEEALSKQALTNATLQKLFKVMVADVRVGLIKIFDRLHNMQTIGANSRESQVRNSEETLAVYAPLANRLGMWKVKTELESLSFETLDEPNFYLAQKMRQQLRHQHSLHFSQVHAELAAHFTSVGLPFQIKQQLESIPSIYRASHINGTRTRLMLDPHLRVVVLLKDVPSCYQALGHVHQLWRPVAGTFDDYIAAPRVNLYQSLHTTVIHDKSGQRIKVRLQTEAMHTLAQIGILAQWMYKDKPLWSEGIEQRVEALIEGISGAIEGEEQNAEAVVQHVVEDIFSNQIVVYTPTGDMKELPKGATPLDFAYKIHTEVGEQCREAFVNEEAVALNVALKDGDWVRVVKDGRAPKRVWLDEDLGYLTTRGAKDNVKKWFRKLSAEVARCEGEKILNGELRLLGLEGLLHDEVAELLGRERVEDLYYALGYAELLPTKMATELLENRWREGGLKNIGTTVRSDEGEQFVVLNAGGRAVSLCHVCLPRPDDSIQGFLEEQDTITIHRTDCYILQDASQTGRLKLNWGEGDGTIVKEVPVQVEVYDRPGLIFEITELIKHDNINLTEVHAQTTAGQAVIEVVLEVTTPRQLVAILHQILALVNVHSVRCVKKLNRQIW